MRLTAPPAEGAANAALIAQLAAELDVPRSSVWLEAGRKRRLKLVAVAGLESADLVARWPGLAVDKGGRPDGNAPRRR